MKPKILLVGTLINEKGQLVDNGYLWIKDDKIHHVDTTDPLSTDEDVIRYNLPKGCIILPGMIDIHIHGAAGADFMDGTQKALEIIAKHLPAEGTTSFLATTMTEETSVIHNALNAAANFIKQSRNSAAEMLGIHLEGPFISHKRAGAQPKSFILQPDVHQFNEFQKSADDLIKLVTLAPEMDGGLELTKSLSSQDVIASIGHSDSSYVEVKDGIEAGISHVTHLFNGMRGMHHRDPGVAGAALLEDELKVEMIVDGVHASPEMIRLAYHSTGSERTILITDSMRAKGLGEGTYTLGGQQVSVKADEARLIDGTLAGSILPMNIAVKNMMDYTHCSWSDIVKMTSENAAKELQIFERKGSLSVGKDADITVLTEECDVLMTFCRGELVYQRKGERV
ncbi:N-acetylglucosamine-6-phosphate deacetylase [Fictibacillus norfolkensis]|uniref:N-acetylglucosamine-6-phosphate deacetylase n=1 Tax=Fictibacillus norfolkensis TaxID=2762233 RepID=A0ABR8SH79_9BACL|nr:N-acetylglucosamine-6-phosphate deacetylase [Fictibacillus norfolkensis]MBD7962743.1 N-acetylglucosamine-6-phosphate deacetylase [Fictibacillus norfolkensis]